VVPWRAIIDLLAHFEAIETDSYRLNKGISLDAAIGGSREETETFGGLKHRWRRPVGS
jgi:hypothetical protein